MKKLVVPSLAACFLLSLPAWAQEPPPAGVAPEPAPEAAAPEAAPQPYPQPADPYAEPVDPEQAAGPAEPYVEPPAGYDPSGVAVDEDAVGYDDAGAEAEDDGYDAADDVDDGYDPEAYTDFQGALSPYGEWVVSAEYGRVWVPSAGVVGVDFAPYATGGHWELTEYGWTWVSDWDWGWAPFHYGRWLWLGGHGWCWRPGRVWGPAWVSWRYGGGYVGWAPLGPRGYRVAPPPRSVRIGAPPPGGVGLHAGWHFTAASAMASPRLALVGRSSVPGAWARTRALRNVQLVNRYRVEAGPDPRVIATAARRPLRPVALRGVAHAMPRATIVPRVAPRVPQYRAPMQPQYRAPMRPQYRAPTQPQYRAPMQPQYRAPMQPQYRAPMRPQYRAPMRPQYHAPPMQFHAPMQSRPSPSSYHRSSPAPISHPSFARPSFHFGGGRHR